MQSYRLVLLSYKREIFLGDEYQACYWSSFSKFLTSLTFNYIQP